MTLVDRPTFAESTRAIAKVTPELSRGDGVLSHRRALADIDASQ